MLYALDTFFVHIHIIAVCLWLKYNRLVRDYGMVCKGYEPGYSTTMVQKSGALSITPFGFP